MCLQEQLKKYAELAIRVGVNVQPGQNVVIGYGSRQVFPEHAAFAQLLTDEAYRAGAKFVQVDFGDEGWFREAVRHGSLDTLEARAKHYAAWVQTLADEGAAFVAIPATNPDLFVGVDPERVTRANRVIASAYRSFNDRRTNDEYSWTLISAPTREWADKVYPELPQNERVPQMWQDILACARADGENPVADWKTHLANLSKRKQYLNDLQIRKLHYTGPGTDFTVAFPQGYIWVQANHQTPQGVSFVANIPTEEVYTVPLKTGVNGTVSSTMPLNHNGALIEGIQLRFEQGRIVEYTSKTGQDALRNIIETDEGSHFLGEVALVPVDSPIYRRGRLFYNTLFDENASCHLAIGNAYALIEGGNRLPKSEWESHGMNTSLVHVDFMIGSDQLNIDAETANGQSVPILRGGKWSQTV